MTRLIGPFVFLAQAAWGLLTMRERLESVAVQVSEIRREVQALPCRVPPACPSSVVGFDIERKRIASR